MEHDRVLQMQDHHIDKLSQDTQLKDKYWNEKYATLEHQNQQLEA